MATSKQSTDRIAAAQQARDHSPRLSERFNAFYMAHRKDAEGALSPCTSNCAAISKYCADRHLDLSDPSSFEIALLSLGKKLEREIPAAPTTPWKFADPLPLPPPGPVKEQV